jgi:hypothetical protein
MAATEINFFAFSTTNLEQQKLVRVKLILPFFLLHRKILDELLQILRIVEEIVDFLFLHAQILEAFVYIGLLRRRGVDLDLRRPSVETRTVVVQESGFVPSFRTLWNGLAVVQQPLVVLPYPGNCLVILHLAFGKTVRINLDLLESGLVLDQNEQNDPQRRLSYRYRFIY